MKYCLLAVFFSFAASVAVAQTREFKELSVNYSSVWNRTKIFDGFSGARSTNRTADAWSRGASAGFAFGLTRHFYGIAGVGYFDRRFNFHRPFYFYEPVVSTRLLYHTKRYAYQSLDYLVGIGYRVKLESRNGKIFPAHSEARFSATADVFHTFRQEFEHDFDANLFGNPNPQVRRDRYFYGATVSLKAGMTRTMYKQIGLGFDVVLPVFNRFRKDEIFAEDRSEFHRADRSISVSIHLAYRLKS